MILVIVDQLSKQAIFILTTDTITLTLYELTKLFVIHVLSNSNCMFTSIVYQLVVKFLLIADIIDHEILENSTVFTATQ